jgi:type IV fimbrial biogenesis protein FimT
MLYTPQRCHVIKSVKPSLNSRTIKLNFGVTLIELMVNIGITSLLIAIALPNLNGFIVEMRVDNEISLLSRLLTLARNHAIHLNNKVIICPISQNGGCSADWREKIIVFVDNNGNGKYDVAENELLIATKSAIKKGDQLTYATNRTKITYQQTGHLFGLSNGTLRYCPQGYKDKSRAIVVARSGRFYVTTDNNSDGIDETRSNKIIQCN